MINFTMNLSNWLEYTPDDFAKDVPSISLLLEEVRKNGVHCISELEEILQQPIEEVVEYFFMRLSNTNVMKIDMKDLSEPVALVSSFVELLDADENYFTYLSTLASLYFKMRDYDAGEACLVEYLKKTPEDGDIYLELMFDFDAIAHDKESALYYGNLALSQENLTNREGVMEYMEDLES